MEPSLSDEPDPLTPIVSSSEPEYGPPASATGGALMSVVVVSVSLAPSLSVTVRVTV